MKKKPFLTRKYSRRLVTVTFNKDALKIRRLCRQLGQTAMEIELSDRIKLRQILGSLLRNAERLEGKS